MHSWVFGSQVWDHKAVRRHRGSQGGAAALRVTRQYSSTEGHKVVQRHRGSQGGAAAPLRVTRRRSGTEGRKGGAERHRGQSSLVARTFSATFRTSSASVWFAVPELKVHLDSIEAARWEINPGVSAATRMSIQRGRGTIAPAIDLEVLLQA